MREAVAVVQNDIIVLQYDGWRFFSVQYPTKPAKYAKSFLYLFYRVNKRPVDYNELLLSTQYEVLKPDQMVPVKQLKETLFVVAGIAHRRYIQ